MNVKCSKDRVYSTNIYHLLAQQLQAIYFFKIEHSLDKLNLYYQGPFEDLLKLTEFVNVLPLSSAPSDCVHIAPIKDTRNIKTYAHFLKFVLLPKIKKTEAKKITIIQRTKNRKIQNINELTSSLSSLGTVEVVVLDGMLFLEQLEQLYNSSIVIMPHGAAMAFAMLLSKNTHIIELYPENFSINYYANFAKKHNVPHTEIECKSFMEHPSPITNQYIKFNQNANGTVDKVKIMKDHKLRSALRDVDSIIIDVPIVTELCSNIIEKTKNTTPATY